MAKTPHRASPAWVCVVCLACNGGGEGHSSSSDSSSVSTASDAGDYGDGDGDGGGPVSDSGEGDDNVLDWTSASDSDDGGWDTGGDGDGDGDGDLPPLCLAEGTRVDTPDGARLIQTLEVGDSIYAFDPHSGERVVTEVSAVREGRRECFELRLDDDTRLFLTKDHPVYSPRHDDYAHAGHWLSPELDEVLLVEGGRSRRIAAKGIPDSLQPRRVFDISVRDELCNFIANGVLVHNKPPIDKQKSPDEQIG